MTAKGVADYSGAIPDEPEKTPDPTNSKDLKDELQREATAALWWSPWNSYGRRHADRRRPHRNK